MKKNKIIITGGNGFIGSNLAKRLYSLGHKNLVIVDRNKSKNSKIKTVLGSFSDKDLLSRTINKNDIVVHLACSSIPATSESNREKDIEENVIGTLNLLDVCIKKGAGKFVFVSSGGTVYGDYGKKLLKEEFNCNPANSHGAMKLAIEKYIQIFNRLYGLKYVIARKGNVYGRIGDRNRQQGAIDVFLQKILNSEQVEIWGDGNSVRDYVFIDDAVEFLVKAIKNPIQGVFNVGTGKGTPLKEIIKIIS